MLQTSMKNYLSNAVEASGVALITGIEERRDLRQLGDLWRHYTGLRTMYDAEPDPQPEEMWDPDYNISFSNINDTVIKFPNT